MTYLVDANVLCEPTRPSPAQRVLAWLEAHETELAVDPIILGEIHTGILVLPPGRRRSRLEGWFEAVVRTIDCLDWDAEVGLRWSWLVADLKRRGEVMPLLDAMIAATALHHGLVVATRNVRDFRRARVDVVDPFA